MNNATENNIDIVISTYVHLFRNLCDFPFVSRMNNYEKQKLLNTVKNAINENDLLSKSLKFIDMENIKATQAVSLVERNLISAEFLSECSNRGVFVNKDETESLMINEDDHLHFQTVSFGLNLVEAYRRADEIETILGKSLNYAFDNNLGYLTHSPVNLGTGMRASLILHLPALKDGGGIERICTNLSKIGFALRSFYGSGEDFESGIYQLSNQVTLGITEQEAISNLEKIAIQIISRERSLEEELSQDLEIQDMVSRSLAILKSAVIMSNAEFLKLVSNVRLGVSTGLIENVSYETINRLIVEVQPATLTFYYAKTLTTKERRFLRAKRIKEILNNI